MKVHQITLIITLVLLNSIIFAKTDQPSHFKKKNGTITDKPLILTPFIESGNITYAKILSRVNHSEFLDVESYSGYFTVNKTCDSNLFFWYFPAELEPETAPVVLWLQGGPGTTSLFCAINENGPIYLTEKGELIRANYSWSKHFNLLFIDNPVDVGYSFTGDKACLPTEETRVGEELYEAIVQFFKVFSDVKKNDFYLTGHSYAGKYVPALAYTIHNNKNSTDIKINLKGLFIGNALVDTLYQHRYSPYLYQIGLIDEDGQKQMEELENQLTKAIVAENWEQASKLYDYLLMDGIPSLFNQLTGMNVTGNYVTGEKVGWDYVGVIENFFNRKDIKMALHTGPVDFLINSDDVASSLKLDMVKSVSPMLIEILNNDYQVLLYSGQLDTVIPQPLTQDLINVLEFKGKSKYQSAKRIVWKVDEEIAGYVKAGGGLTFALVRNAGHSVAPDQPKALLELLLGFTKPNCVILEEGKQTLNEECKKKI